MRKVFLALAVVLGASLNFAATPTAPATSSPATATAAAKIDQPADKPATRTGGWLGIHNRLVALAKAGNIDLYFEGDSITDYWGRNTTAQPYRANFD